MALATALPACSPAPVANAPVVKLTIPAGGCSPTVDGQAVSFEELAKRIRQWDGSDTEVHFMPDPNASYECVDRVLNELHKARRMKLGFVGNEKYVVDGPEESK